jgi:hypothetical protein
MNPPINLAQLQSVFAPCVFLKWPTGVKGDKRKWKHLTLNDMTPEYLADLLDGNVGIALGRVSKGLCTIDLDEDELMKPFMEANPWTANTAVTRGARGCQIWVRVKGEYPPASALKRHGNRCGEWRADGCQSIIPPSIHPDACKPYLFLFCHPVVEIFYNEIRFPGGMDEPPLGDSMVTHTDTQHNKKTQHTTEYTQLCHRKTSIATVTEDSPPNLSLKPVTDDNHSFHELLVEPHLAKEKGHNNAKLFNLAQAVKLAETMGKPVDTDLVFELWWNHSEPYTKKSLNKDTYRCEFRRALGCIQGDPVMKAWQGSAGVTAPGSEKLDDSRMKRLAAFCYCLRNAEGRFFLSCRKVGTIFDLHHQDAHLWLKALEDLGLIWAVRRGSHKSNKATEYQYIGTDPTPGVPAAKDL